MSNLEQRQKRIEALLAANCLTYEEIGRRVGVSKQRIGQIAKMLDVIGRDRRRGCALFRHSQKAEQQKRDGLLAVLLRHVPDTYAFETVPTKKPLTRYAIRQRVVLINDYFCALMIATLRPEQPTPSVQIHSPRGINRNADFLLYYNADHDLWLIVPHAEVARASTMFSLNPNWKGHGKDWRPFINAWHLLEKKVA